ncbi:MAG: N-6 DNA methylase [Candidatus Pacebacteria bacterium]|nr:N-6 DNA methylase [Candidatus Paceibacterota bacterium]
MSFRTETEQYLKKMGEFYRESLRVKEMTAELSYRPLLNDYFSRISEYFGQDIKNIYEPRQQARAGRPDWRFYNGRTLGIYGYIEAKPFDPAHEVSVEEHAEQVRKYIAMGYRVALTDGLEFIFFEPGNPHPSRFSLTDKNSTDSLFGVPDDGRITRMESAFAGFFGEISPRRLTEQQLMQECALRAKLLSDEIAVFADLPKGSGLNENENAAISVLGDLKGIIQEHHDPLLNNKDVFAAFVSQVLIFGLIYAHRILGAGKQTPKERYDDIRNFWTDRQQSAYTQRLKPFRALAELLKEEIASMGALGVWYDDCCLMLSHVELREAQVATPDYHMLFEKFLTAFDPQTRFDYGAYYTPAELSSYSVRLVEKIVETHFPDRNLYGRGNKLIDPCCGTGSFLEILLRSSLAVRGEAEIAGFEILPAPYALAHYRISSVLPEYVNVKIVLTNTLSDALEKTIRIEGENLLEEEQQTARNLAKPPLTLIIGNPPSSDSSIHSQGDDFEIIGNLMDDFRPPESERRSRQNVQKQLQNEYMKFLRWAGNKAVKSGDSIIALILPSSFAENPSYLYARKWFAANFMKFWILDIDKDGRTGIDPSSLFHTLQGRLLLVAARESGHGNARKEYYYHSIADSVRAERLGFLRDGAASSSGMLAPFVKFDVSGTNPVFRPRKEFDGAKYDKFWSLYSDGGKGARYIFERHCSGVKLAPSSIFVHVDEPILMRRSREIADEGNETSALIDRWYRGQDRPPSKSKFSPEIRSAFREELDSHPENMKKYSYRPMLNLPAFISENILRKLAQTGGGGTRYRPEILKAYGDGRTIGIAVAPAPKELGPELRRFASFCWYLPDNDLSKRGNAHVFCNYFPEYKKARCGWDGTPLLNINEKLMKRTGQPSPDNIIVYVYGILCSDKFVDSFEPVLFTTSGANQQPRIPIPADSATFDQIAELGKKLALFEKYVDDDDIRLNREYSAYAEKFSRISLRLDSFDVDGIKESVVLKGDNVSFEIKPVPREVLEFEIGGYRVLQQWLKMYSHSYTRTDFTVSHMKRFLYLLQGVAEQIETVEALDQKVSALLDSDGFI